MGEIRRALAFSFYLFFQIETGQAVAYELTENHQSCDLQNVNITCDRDKFIVIEYLAFYYDPNCAEQCCNYSNTHSTVGADDNDISAIRRECLGRLNCSLDLSGNRTFGPNGVQTPSYLIVKYHCIPENRTTSVCANERLESDGLPMYLTNKKCPTATTVNTTFSCSIEASMCFTNLTISMLDVGLDAVSCEHSIELRNRNDDLLEKIHCGGYNSSLKIEKIVSHYVRIDYLNYSSNDHDKLFLIGFTVSGDNVSFSLSCPQREETNCQATECEDAINIPNGNALLHEIYNTQQGSFANITCHTGYEPDKPTISCWKTGKWENATCLPKDCGNLTTVLNGKYVLEDETNTTYGAMATVTCYAGYKPQSTTIKCLETGQWSSSLCNAKDCGDVPDVLNGKSALKDKNNSTFGAVATVTCDEGYLPDNYTIICLENGKWSAGSLCTAKDCGNLPGLLNGKYVLEDENNTTFGALATVTCEKGYRPDNNTIICLGNGQWSHSLCTAKSCGIVPDILNGKSTLKDENNTTLGAMATVTCDIGYFSDRDIIMCLENGQWSSATCTIKDCRNVPTLLNGKYVLEDENKTTFGAMAHVTCDRGYVSDSIIISCLENGQWSSSLCSAKDCGNVPDIVNGKYVLQAENNTTLNAVATVICDLGYESDRNITCLENGKWSISLCNAINCGQPANIKYGSVKLVDVSISIYNAVAEVKCQEGFRPKKRTITCKETGLWENGMCESIQEDTIGASAGVVIFIVIGVISLFGLCLFKIYRKKRYTLKSSGKESHSMSSGNNKELLEHDDDKQNIEMILANQAKYQEKQKTEWAEDLKNEYLVHQEEESVCVNLKDTEHNVQVQVDVTNEKERRCTQVSALEEVNETGKDDKEEQSFVIRSAGRVNSEVRENRDFIGTVEIDNDEQKEDEERTERGNIKALNDQKMDGEDRVMNLTRNINEKGDKIGNADGQESKETLQISDVGGFEDDEEGEFYSPTSDESENDTPIFDEKYQDKESNITSGFS